MEVVWPACPLECDIIVRYLQPDLKTSFCSNYKLNIMSLHKCLHGQILMNNFPAAFITHLCRKVLSVYAPSDAMWWAPSPHSSNTFSCAQVIILFFFLSLTERERRSERFAFLCSLLEIESRTKTFYTSPLGCRFTCLISLCAVFLECVCLWGRMRAVFSQRVWENKLVCLQCRPSGGGLPAVHPNYERRN